MAGRDPNRDGEQALQVDESTRLLPGDDANLTGNAGNGNGIRVNTPTPLPKAQLAALIAVRIADPIAYHQIFPYINQLLADLKIAKPEEVGMYSGLIESAYSLAQVFSVYQWGKVSDIVGRRPVVVVGLVGVAATTIAFGLSTSLVGIIVFRFLGGLLAGNTAVIHSILAEITDETNQDLAVPIYSLSWPVGTVIGPLIGGTLGNAVVRYPAWGLFVEHPYLPACIASAACALVAAGLGIAILEETLPSRRKREGQASTSASPEHTNPVEVGRGDMSVKELLSVPVIRALAISGLALSALSLAFDVVVTLFCYSTVESGGLDLEPSIIGNFLAFARVLAIFLRFFIMPYILRNFDFAKTYNACMMIWPIAFGGLPILNAIARYQPFGSGAPTSAVIWIGLSTLLALSKAAAIAYSLSMLLIKQHSPTPASLGQSNGIVQFAMSIGRAVGPVVVSTLFTVCNGLEWMRRWGLAWTWAGVMVCFSLVGAHVTKGIASR